MKFSEALLIVKEFFLEILGFLIPGMIFLLFSVFFVENEIINLIFSVFDKEFHVYLIIIFSYVLGYVIYGASELLDSFGIKTEKIKSKNLKNLIKLLPSFKKQKSNLELEIQGSSPFEMAKASLITNKIIKDDRKIQVREVRNLAMSYLSKSEKSDIYTFTFRSDLCRHLATVFWFYILLSFALIVLYLNPSSKVFFVKILVFKRIWSFIPLILLLLILIFFLGKTRKRFFSISHRIPFSMFLAKINNQSKTEENEE